MLKLQRIVNKLELAAKSFEDFYSHQFIKFHESFQYKIIRLLGILMSQGLIFFFKKN